MPAKLMRRLWPCFSTFADVCSPTNPVSGKSKKPALALTVGGRFNAREGAFTMALIPEFRRSTLLAAMLGLLATMALTVSGVSPARADRCDDLAAQLKGQIDGLKVGITAARVIYLSHPLAKELSSAVQAVNSASNCLPRPTAASRSRNSSISLPALPPSSLVAER